MEDGKRIFRIILNILIPAGTIVLVCTMAFEIFYAICSRLVYCPDLQSTGKIFGKKTEAGAEA